MPFSEAREENAPDRRDNNEQVTLRIYAQGTGSETAAWVPKIMAQAGLTSQGYWVNS